MPSRPVWKGHIRIALVSIPVEIYSATKSGAAVAFRQIHEPSGQPIHYEKVVNGIGPVSSDDIQRGFEYEKGRYVLLDDEEIQAVRLESRKTMELSHFVDAGSIPVLYPEKPYYVVPADELAEDAYIVLREALKKTKRAGLGQIVMRGRETLGALRWCGRGLVFETLRYADEVNRSDSYFRDIPDTEPDPELLDLAIALIDKRSGEFDAKDYRDRYVDALAELVERKRKSGGKLVEPAEDKEPAATDVSDLMAALRESLQGSGSARGSRRKSETPARRAGGRRKAA